MRSDELNRPVHERLTEELIERLRQGVTPWQRTRQTGDVEALTEMTSAAGRRYEEPAEWQRSAEQPIHEQRMHGWTGLMQIKGAVKRDGAVRWAEDLGVEPDFYRM
jgi:antirestriction protein ArdC